VLASLGLFAAGSQTSQAAENMVVCTVGPVFTVERFKSVDGYSTLNPGEAVPGYGYVYANDCGIQPGLGFTDPSQGDYQFNSAGFANRIEHVGVGVYQVYFTGLGVGGGVAQVTTYGGGEPDQCRVGYWSTSPSPYFAEVVNVYCYDINGNPTDRRFTATYTNLTKAAYGFGYLWADQPSTASYTPRSNYQFSTAGTPNQIVHRSTGRYQVTMTGIPDSSPSEDVMVSTYGTVADGRARCRVEDSSDQTALVRCDAGGLPVDSTFTLSSAAGGNLLGAPNSPLLSRPAGPLPSAYAWVVGNAGTQPSAAWSFSTPATGSWSQSYNATSGLTTVIVPIGSTYGNVQVVAFGSTESCDLVETGDGLGGTPNGIEVQCYDSGGNTIPGEFNLFQTGKVP